MNATELAARITSIKARIAAYEQAALDLASGAIESYTLDTGQSRQTVKKFDLMALNDLIDGLYNQCAVLETRLNGNGTLHGVPGF